MSLSGNPSPERFSD